MYFHPVVLSLVLLLVPSLAPSLTLPPHEPSFVHNQLQGYLIRYGYLENTLANTRRTQSWKQVKVAVRRLQEFAGIPATGVLDSATLQVMRKRRCGVRDKEEHKSRGKRYTLQGGKWGRTNLTWSIKHWPRNIDPHLIREELARALRVWSDVSKLTFNETRRTDADIVVSFFSGPHGDDYAFDGPGNILAHAFFPMKGLSLGGDAHFDADEKWVKNSAMAPQENHVSSNEGVSLFAVAAHEFGHSLGLSHSSVSGSLMFPYYQAMKDDFVLPYDDTVGIQQLYGARNAPQAPSVPSRPVPPTTPKPHVTSDSPPKWPFDTPTAGDDFVPDTCNTSFDAISSIRNEVFFFKGKYFWRFSDTRRLETETPVEISRFWYNFPRTLRRIDAVYERPKDKMIVFFVGKRYWVFSGNYPLVGYPKPLTNLGLPRDLESLDGAMVWGHNGKTYLFAGQQYWRMDEAQEKVEGDYPRDVNVWRGIPANMDAVFQWHRNGVTYFFKETHFWRLDNRKMQASHDSPRLYQDYWFRSACRPKHTFPADFDFDVMNHCIRWDLSLMLLLLSFALILMPQVQLTAD